MGVFRMLVALLVGFFVAWTAVALQHLAASGLVGRVSAVGVLVGLVVVTLLGLRLLA